MIHIAIPARKGSKRLKDKNKVDVNGQPLVQYTINFALLALKHELVHSASIITDDLHVLNLAENTCIDTSYSRPSELSVDSTSTTATIRHWINFKNFSSEDNILLLQPTSPFRYIKDLIQITERNLDPFQMLYGVVLLPGKSGDYLTMSERNFFHKDKNVYFTDGSYYLTSVKRIQSEVGLEVQNTDDFFVTSIPYPIDIDTPRDLESLKYLKLNELHD